MPLTVEPTKPRLCNDNRFLNLWMDDRPFSLNRLDQLPLYVSKGAYQTVCDDKSGYDHILLAPSSRKYFGFQWDGWSFISNTIPFGWKLSAYVYHSTGLLVSHYFRSIGIPCSLYIDDRHSSQIRLPHESSLVQSLDPEKVNLISAQIVSFLVCYTLVRLGYRIGLQKSILQPSQSVPYLGFQCDSRLQAFCLLSHKKQKFISLVEAILESSHVSITDLQRLAGKCISMSMAVPGTRLFTNEINLAISRASRSSRPLPLSGPLRREIEHWLFLKSWSGFLPWRLERHHQLVLFTDASSYCWAGVLNQNAVPLSASDYWSEEILSSHIVVKEALALSNALSSFASTIKDSRVDVYIDSSTLFHAWNGQSARSRSLLEALKSIFEALMSTNCILRLFQVPSVNNLADRPSRSLTLADSRLSASCWKRLQDASGGPNGHSVDLMALPSNVMRSSSGAMLPFFSPHPTLGCSGVNLFSQSPDIHPSHLFSYLYVFPPSPMFSASCPHLQYHSPLWFCMFCLVDFGRLFFHIALHLVYSLRMRVKWVFYIHPPKMAIKIPGLCLGIYGLFVSNLFKQTLDV